MSIFPNSEPESSVASTSAPKIKFGAMRSLRPTLMCSLTVAAPLRFPLRIGFGMSNAGKFLVAAVISSCNSSASRVSAGVPAAISCSASWTASSDGAALLHCSCNRCCNWSNASCFISAEVGRFSSSMLALVYWEMARSSCSCFLPLMML